VEMESVIPKLSKRGTELLGRMGQLRTMTNEAFKKMEREYDEIVVLSKGFLERTPPADILRKNLQNCVGQLNRDYY